MNKMSLNRQKAILISVFLLIAFLFVTYLLLILQINFQQNDDLYYYSTVKSFLNGNFNLPDKMAPTFYVQGFLGGAFSAIFGVEHLPVLTLIVSVLCLVLFFSIIRANFKQPVILSFAISLLLFFNPLFQYSILGFMTENYLLLFVLFSLFYYLQYANYSRKTDLILCSVYWIIGFFVKQVILVLPLAYLTHSYIRKDKNGFITQAFLFFSTLFFYLNYFPHTVEMNEKGLRLSYLLNFNYSYAVFYGILLYLTAFLWPLMIPVIFSAVTAKKKKTILLLGNSIILYIILNHKYHPMSVSWGEFPFFENVFERTGFLPRQINGTKYIFRASFDLYRYWEIFSKIILAGYISAVFFTGRVRRLISSVHFYVITFFIALMIVTVIFFDRYILMIIPSTALLLFELSGESDFYKSFTLLRFLKNKILPFFLGLFILFLAYFSYFLSNDYVRGLNYVWKKSQELVGQGVSPSKIYANLAWNLTNDSKIISSDYVFTYDSEKVKSNELEDYSLLETHEVKYFLNPFIKPSIYLYKRN